MKNIDASLQTLRENDLKITPQRRAVLQTLLNNSTHPSAQDIWDEIRMRNPKIAFATVYNTLNILSDLGELKALNVGKNCCLFDPRTDPHRHFCCQKCGNVIDIETDETCGYELEGHLVCSSQVIYHGECFGCRHSRET